MKKFITTFAILIAAAFCASAQLSVTAGYSQEQWQVKGASEMGLYNGAYAGVLYSIGISDFIVGELKLSPGIVYNFGLQKNGTTSFHSINIPLEVSYGMAFGIFKPFIFAGPSFQVGISCTSEGYNLYTEEEGIKRFNVFVGGGAGVVIKDKIMVSAGCNYGLIDKAKNDDLFGGRFNQRQLSVGVAYIF